MSCSSCGSLVGMALLTVTCDGRMLTCLQHNSYESSCSCVKRVDHIASSLMACWVDRLLTQRLRLRDRTVSGGNNMFKGRSSWRSVVFCQAPSCQSRLSLQCMCFIASVQMDCDAMVSLVVLSTSPCVDRVHVVFRCLRPHPKSTALQLKPDFCVQFATDFLRSLKIHQLVE